MAQEPSGGAFSRGEHGVNQHKQESEHSDSSGIDKHLRHELRRLAWREKPSKTDGLLRSFAKRSFGDALCQGAGRWGEKYVEAAERTKLDEGTLREFKYVADSIQLSVRTDFLSFGHHKLVAQLTEAEQTKLEQKTLENLYYVADRVQIAVRTAILSAAILRADGASSSERRNPQPALAD